MEREIKTHNAMRSQKQSEHHCGMEGVHNNYVLGVQ